MAKRRIENTTKSVADNPMLMLAVAMGGGGMSRAIEEQEANGQAQLCNSSQIPTKLLHGLTEDHLKVMGFLLGSQCEGDRLFRDATLPEGWKIVRTDHSMWSKVVDDKGRERLSIFYKAAFYDRDAHMSGVRRFSISVYEGEQDKPFLAVKDGERVIKAWPARNYRDYDQSDKDRAEAVAWLNETYPDWEDFTAYWD